MKSSIHSIKGGGDNSSLKKSKSAFKPLIASSLALALGMSIANAQTEITAYNPKGISTSSRWVGAGGVWNDWNGFDQFQVSGNNNPTPYYILSFGQQTGQPIPAFDSNGGFQFTNNGVLESGSQQDSNFTITTNTKALLIGASDTNRGYLAINFIDDKIATTIPSDWNTDTNRSRKAILTFNATTNYKNRAISLIGDIKIRGGIGENKNILQAEFAGDMIGNIHILPLYTRGTIFYKDVNTTFTFNNNASLQGNIYTNLLNNGTLGGAGSNTFNFQTGGIYGGIFADSWNPDNINVSNTINFRTGGASISDVVNFIDGDVVASPGGNNIINFQRTDADGRIGALIRNSGERGDYYDGKNTVNFAGSTLTISRGIATDGSYRANDIGNQITLSKESAKLVIDSQGIIARQTTKLDDQSFQQTNKIIFQKGGTLELKGSNVIDTDSGFNFDGILARDGEKNDIQFGGTQNATINVASEIRSKDGGVNSISFGGIGTNTLNALLNNLGGEISLYLSGTTTVLKNIQNNGGTTIINLGNSTNGVTAIIGGEISTTAGATNVVYGSTTEGKSLTLQGDSNTITTLSANGVSNALKLSGSNAVDASIATLNNGNALDVVFGGGNKANVLTITAVDSNANNALTLKSLSTAEGNGTLEIGDTITSLTVGQATDTLAVSNGKTLNITALDNNTLTLKNAINATGATSLLTVGETSGATVIAEKNLSNVGASLVGNSSSLTLQGDNNTITTLNAGATTNTLALLTGTTNIASAVSVEAGALKFNLNGDSTLSFANSIINQGTQNLSYLEFNINGKSSNTIAGDISTSVEKGGVGASTQFNLADGSNAIIAGSILTQGEDGTVSTDIVFDGTSSFTLQGATNQITSVSTKESTGSGRLTLDATNNGVEASIAGQITGNNITLGFNGATGKKAELTLSAAGNAIKAISLGDGNGSATVANKLVLSAGATNINDAVSVANKQDLAFDLKNGVNLTLVRNLNNAGNAEVNFTEASGTLTSDINTSGNGNTIFNLGLSDGSLTTVTATITGDIANTTNATSTFNIYAATVNFNGKNGLAFTDGTNEIVFGKEGAILNWKNTDGSATQAISTTGGNTNISFNTSGTIAGEISTSDGKTTITINDGKIGEVETISTSGAGATQIDFAHSIGTLKGTISTTGGTTTINVGSDTTRLTGMTKGIIDGAISTTGGVTNVAFKGNDAVLILKGDATLTSVSNSIVSQSRVEDVSTPSTPAILYGSNNGISFYHDERSGNDNFKTLIIGEKDAKDKGISGDGLNFLVYAKSNKEEISNTQPSNRNQVAQTPVYADKVIILSSSNVDNLGNTKESTHHLGVKFEDGTDLKSISYKKDGGNNILIATVANSSGVSFDQAGTTILGFNIADVDYVTEDANDQGVVIENGNYTNYYVGSIKNVNVIGAEQEITATAFSFNYDLYMANLNSLNKRMGELRDNPHSHGVWARIFNGAQTNKQGLETKSNYTTIQAGYDYAFGFEGANNYLGVALSYALSVSTSDKAFDAQGNTVGFGDIYSNAVEVAVYNSYVMDSGWYNDTIAKFSYLMSNFSINDSITQQSANSDTQNFAFTLGDEVGYKFALGDNKEWGITPQMELTFGYFNQSDLKRTLERSGSYLDSTADAVLTLRARVGSNFSYDFKNFTQDKGFNASLYVGTYYEYDYVKGGEISMTTEQQITHNNQFNDIGSDGRVVVNVGTNMSIQDNTRLYFDFEKSFAGDLTTDYQVNFGVRYSFGESNGYAPMVEKPDFKAPLKVEAEDEKDETQEMQTQEVSSSSEEKNADKKIESAKEQPLEKAE